MDISNYTAFFHDGSLSNINHSNDTIILTMTSAEVDPEEIEDKNLISKEDRIEGKLHISQIQRIEIDEKPFSGKWKKEYDNGRIFDFEILENQVLLSVEWVNFPPKPEENFFSNIEIQGKEVWWESSVSNSDLGTLG
jgi:hypothetical protein